MMPDLLHCLIVDDEPLARQLLTAYVEQLAGLTLAGAYENPIEALHFLREGRVNLIFLDIQMEQLDGLQFAQIVGDTVPIVFTTAFDEYALEGYNLNVVDYLLKPISYERFGRAVQKVVAGPVSQGVTEASLANAYLFIKSGHQHQRVNLDDIRYLSGNGDYVTLHLAGGKKLLTLENLGSFANRLHPPRFCRIHRSHVIAMDKIEFIERNRVVLDGVYLPVSQTYHDEFWRLVEGHS
ncbi:LytR/AlgR family response regulator transcription factor [Neolewinella antarctica]|uniref:DNA-binding LytR/AlgR family response regulator n=1 Tax=Neolewinella antarctica TaxID=442734 RepID=A0ABX0X9A8_9BACT|nr:response regulator transcription factor [Neolewinella antarctica]NJC25812.1 DNA-binding LytR/AlgR family response regulator [Neolewinella antarctica]